MPFHFKACGRRRSLIVSIWRLIRWLEADILLLCFAADRCFAAAKLQANDASRRILFRERLKILYILFSPFLAGIADVLRQLLAFACSLDRCLANGLE
jgi:hypothetical protein